MGAVPVSRVLQNLTVFLPERILMRRKTILNTGRRMQEQAATKELCSRL